MAVVLVGLVLWSLLAWVGHVLVDPTFGWVASNAGSWLMAGKGSQPRPEPARRSATSSIILDVSGFLGQAIALLRVVMKPAIIVLWAIGALALIAAPVILPRVGRLLGGRRH